MAAQNFVSECGGPDLVAMAERRRDQRPPMPNLGAPEEVAGGIVFIAPDQASGIAGQILNVDGGHAAR